MCLLGFAMYRIHLPLRTETISERNWRVFTLNSTSRKSLTSVSPVVGHLQIYLRMIWRFFSPNMLSLAKLWKSRFMLPLRIAVDLLQPSPPIESSLHLMFFPFVQIRHRSMDLAYHPGLGPLPDRSRSRDDYSGHLRHSCRSQERFLERFVPSDAPSHSRRPRSRGFPSPKHWNFHGSHIRN